MIHRAALHTTGALQLWVSFRGCHLSCRHPQAMSQPTIRMEQQCLELPPHSQRQQSLWLALLLAAQSCWICKLFHLRWCRRPL